MSDDDAQFEAFLRGEGDLSRQLQALAQPSPSAELDAAIIERARLAVVQQGREAANDPGVWQAAKPQRARGHGLRWSIPAGIAATVLAGLIGQQTYQKGGYDAIEDASSVAVTAPKQAAATPVPAAEAPRAVIMEPERLGKAPVQRESQVEQRRAPMERQADKFARSPVLAPAPQFVPATPAPAPPSLSPAPAPAPVVAAAGAPGESNVFLSQEKSATAKAAQRTVTVTGSRIRSAYEADPAAWLGAIDVLLDGGKNPEAAAEWARFRKAYPDYAVPEVTEKRLQALPKPIDLY